MNKQLRSLFLFFFIFFFYEKSFSQDESKHDFSYMVEDRREKCLQLYKNKKLKYDKNSQLYFVIVNKTIGGDQKKYKCNKPEKMKNAFSALTGSFGMKKATLSMNEEYMENSPFSEFKHNQRIFCERKLKNEKLKYDEKKKMYFEMFVQPMSEPKKKYICNIKDEVDRGPLEALVGINPLGNLATPLFRDKDETVSSNPFEDPQMASAIISLTKAQVYFLDSLDEKEASAALSVYIKNLESGDALGKDELEKTLLQSKEYQELINEKMNSGFKLDDKAKEIFSKGVPFYTKGTALLAVVGITTAGQVSGIGASPLGAIQAVSVFFKVKDAFTAIPLFFSSTNNLLEFGKENDIENLEELQEAKDSLGV